MMQRLANLSIRGKLTLITMIVTATALLLASGALFTRRVMLLRYEMFQSTSIHADMIGRNSTAALSFGNQDDASEVLGALRADEHIDAAWIFLPTGKIFAGYHREDVVPPPSPEVIRIAATRWQPDC